MLDADDRMYAEHPLEELSRYLDEHPREARKFREWRRAAYNREDGVLAKFRALPRPLRTKYLLLQEALYASAHTTDWLRGKFIAERFTPMPTQQMTLADVERWLHEHLEGGAWPTYLAEGWQWGDPRVQADLGWR